MVSTISPLLIKDEVKKANATKILVKKIPKINSSKNKKRNLASLINKKKPGIPSPSKSPMDKEVVIPKNFPKNNDLRVTDFDNNTSEKGIDSKNVIPEKVMEYSGITIRVKFIVLTSNLMPFWSPKKLNTNITKAKSPE